jgi:hypothetical protein
LTVTATGGETSKVEHTTPEISVKRSGKTLFKLSAKKPTQDIPIGIPRAGLRERAGKAKLAPLPIIGGAAETTTGRVVRLGEKSRREVTDLFILRVGVGGLLPRSKPVRGHRQHQCSTRRGPHKPRPAHRRPPSHPHSRRRRTPGVSVPPSESTPLITLCNN